MINDDYIDLTERRDFGRRFDNRNITRSISKLEITDRHLLDEVLSKVDKEIYGKFPWSVYPINPLYLYDGVLALGNKEQRKESIEIYYWGTRCSVVCDCCGKNFKHIPWSNDYGLCPKCRFNNSHSNIHILDNMPFSHLIERN